MILLKSSLEGGKTIPEELSTCARRAKEIADELDFIQATENDEMIYWYEKRGKGTFLSATPVNVSNELKENLFSRKISFIFTSATLTTDNNFRFINSRLGLSDPTELIIPSPFDYTRQAVKFPGGMQQDHVGSDQASDNMKLQPGGYSSPTGAAASFAQRIEHFGHQH